jgi:hypothetical protein
MVLLYATCLNTENSLRDQRDRARCAGDHSEGEILKEESGARGVLLKMGATSNFQLSSTKSQTNAKIEIQNRKQESTLKHQLMNR